MYSRVKRRKSLRRNTYSMQAHHKAMSKTEQEEEEEDEGTEGQIHIDVLQTVGLCGKKQHPLSASSSTRLNIKVRSQLPPGFWVNPFNSLNLWYFCSSVINALFMVRFSWWGGRGRRRRRGRWRWRWRRGWSRRGGRRKRPALQPEAAEDCAEIRSTSNWYLIIHFDWLFCMWVLQKAAGLLKLPKCSFVEWLALVFSLRASEQKAEQPFPFWHPQIPSKKKPYKVCGNY